MNLSTRNIFIFLLPLIYLKAHAAFTIIDPVAGPPLGKRENLKVVETQKSEPLTEVQRLRLENIALRTELTRMQQYQTASFQVKNKVAASKTQQVQAYTFLSTGTTIHITPTQLNKIIKLAKTSHKIVVSGFTDSTDSKSVNFRMGQLRANSFKDMLTKRGIPSSKIQIQSFPGVYVASNKTVVGRSKNRRIVVSFY